MKITSIFPVIFLSLFLIIQTGCDAGGARNEHQSSSATLAFTGDIIMHIPVKSCARLHNRVRNGESLNNDGFDYLFRDIVPYLNDTDIAVGNMEFPVAPPYTSKPWIFNSPPGVLRAMKRAGFTTMHLGNNHILDQGEEGLHATLRELKTAGLDYTGIRDKHAKYTGVIKNVNGIRIGLLGYTAVMNYAIPSDLKNVEINWLPVEKKARASIKEIKSRCDYLVVIVHGGTEYADKPDKEIRKRYRQLVTDGADLVVGHHPHVLQEVEMVEPIPGKRRYIFYSLGNLISNQSSVYPVGDTGLSRSTRHSVILKVRLDRTAEGRIRQGIDLVPVYTSNTLFDSRGYRNIQVRSLENDMIRLFLQNGSRKSPKKSIAFDMDADFLYSSIKSIEHVLLLGKPYREISFLKPEIPFHGKRTENQ